MVLFRDEMGPITAEVVEEKQRRDLRGRKIVDAPRRAELLAAYAMMRAD